MLQGFVHKSPEIDFACVGIFLQLDSQLRLSFKEVKHALTGWLSWLECHHIHQKVMGLIPG